MTLLFVQQDISLAGHWDFRPESNTSTYTYIYIYIYIGKPHFHFCHRYANVISCMPGHGHGCSHGQQGYGQQPTVKRHTPLSTLGAL